MSKLTGKVAVVTGASKGIGAGLVAAYLKRGYCVVANSRNIKEESPFAASDSLALVGGDIAEAATSDRIVQTALSRFERIDVLANPHARYTQRASSATNPNWRTLSGDSSSVS